MSGGSVDDPCIAALCESHSLSSCGVRQAEEREIRAVNELSALVRVLALVLVDTEQLYIGAVLESLKYFKSGRAFLTVDVYLNHCKVPPVSFW